MGGDGGVDKWEGYGGTMGWLREGMGGMKEELGAVEGQWEEMM